MPATDLTAPSTTNDGQPPLPTPTSGPSHFSRDLATLWIVATSALLIGLLINQFRDKPIPLVYQDKETRILAEAGAVSDTAATVGQRGSRGAQSSLPVAIPLGQFRELRESALVLDARPEIFHRLGHIPGALSLARDDFQNSYAKLRERIENDKAQPLILYCASSSCEDAELVRKALAALGFTNIGIYTGGWAEWAKAGLPEERND